MLRYKLTLQYWPPLFTLCSFESIVRCHEGILFFCNSWSRFPVIYLSIFSQKSFSAFFTQNSDRKTGEALLPPTCMFRGILWPDVMHDGNSCLEAPWHQQQCSLAAGERCWGCRAEGATMPGTLPHASPVLLPAAH